MKAWILMTLILFILKVIENRKLMKDANQIKELIPCCIALFLTSGITSAILCFLYKIVEIL